MKKIISVFVAILGFTFVSMAQPGNTTACNGKKQYDACNRIDGTKGQCNEVKYYNTSKQTLKENTVTKSSSTGGSETNALTGSLKITDFGIGANTSRTENNDRNTTAQTANREVIVIESERTALECQ